MTPTRAQIIEGRDEALEHLGIRPEEWERTSHERRRRRMTYVAGGSPQRKAAALTVAMAEMEISQGFDPLAWKVVIVTITFTTPLRSTGVDLVA